MWLFSLRLLHSSGECDVQATLGRMVDIEAGLTNLLKRST